MIAVCALLGVALGLLAAAYVTRGWAVTVSAPAAVAGGEPE